eukprot:Lithocolla_globosa_v1_NODE_773_length_3298_cov_177.812828.p1 type:complete len:313 gc:universal NODE_773_length_3298_cov_177.812828:1987-1049(-)
MGDMNIDLLKTDFSSDYIQNLMINSFKSLILYPTHLTNSSETLIDHIFTNNTTKHFTAGIIYGDVADYIPTFCVFNNSHTYFKETFTSTFFDTSKYKSSDFRNKLQGTKLTSILNKKDPNKPYSEFIELFPPISQKHLPMKIKSNKKAKHKARKPWIYSKLKKQIKKQHKLYAQTQNDPSNLKINAEHKKFRKYQQKAKKEYYAQLFNKHEHNQKKTWGIIKNILRTNNSKTYPKQLNIKQEDGTETIVTGKKEIENSFNNFFTTEAAKLVKNIKEKPPDKQEEKITFAQYVKQNTSTCFSFSRAPHKLKTF